jgi:hypothetical protein
MEFALGYLAGIGSVFLLIFIFQWTLKRGWTVPMDRVETPSITPGEGPKNWYKAHGKPSGKRAPKIQDDKKAWDAENGKST